MRKRRLRAIVISTEMILLLTAVIMFSVIAFFGISKAVLSQATSSKQTLVAVRAEAWKIGEGVAVSLYLHNTGTDPVTITSGGIKYSSPYGFISCKQSFGIGVTINPGESKVISFALGPGCPGCYGNCENTTLIDDGNAVYTYVTVKEGTSSLPHEVGVVVEVKKP